MGLFSATLTRGWHSTYEVINSGVEQAIQTVLHSNHGKPLLALAPRKASNFLRASLIRQKNIALNLKRVRDSIVKYEGPWPGIVLNHPKLRVPTW